MIPRKIVITGGPGTGKTSVIQELDAAGYHCFHEVIRSMTEQAKKEGSSREFITNPLAFVTDPYRFNKDLLNSRIAHYRQAAQLSKPVVFYDRGLPDVLAYMDYFDQAYGPDFVLACEDYRYDKVLVLPPWEAIYVSDNERMESFEEALEIHQYLLATYKRFGYEPIGVPEGTVKERAAHILMELTSDGYL